MTAERLTVTEFAPAKVNLALHVTGRRDDGYHLLDSLVVFAGTGDLVSVAPAAQFSLSVCGPRAAGVPDGPENLVLRAAALLAAPGDGAAITLEKHLPAASGIGGGSSDAAAAIRALSRLWSRDLPQASALAALGADVPVCLVPKAQRMQGIGEDVTPVAAMPGVALLLVNPGVSVATPAIFRALEQRDGTPLPAQIPGFTDAAALADFLHAQRNDLEPAAIRIAPVIGSVIAALAATRGCLIARMSGSGATCFGLYRDLAAAQSAAQVIARQRPGWWISASETL